MRARGGDAASLSTAVKLYNAPQFGYPACLDPLHYENVAFVIETRAVRANERAGRESSGNLISYGAPIPVGIFAFAETCDHAVLAIKNDYLA